MATRKRAVAQYDMSLTDLTTAICGQPFFRDLPIRDVYEIAEQAQAAAIKALKRR